MTFVRGLIPFRPPADAFAQHLYPALGPTASVAMPSYNRLTELIGELDAVRPGLPILITEFGWTTTPTTVRTSHVTEQQQETYLREALDMLAAIPRVRLAIWFNLQDNTEWAAGLRRVDLSPKPSWTTFSGLAKFRAPGAPPAALELPSALPAPPSAPPDPLVAMPMPAALPTPIAAPIAPRTPLTLALTTSRSSRRGHLARFVVHLNRAITSPIVLQRRVGRRFLAVARSRSSSTTVVIRARLRDAGRQSFRVRGREAGIAVRSAPVRVLVTRQ